jgi:hypothetical protein
MWGLLVADGGSWWMNERLLEVFFWNGVVVMERGRCWWWFGA